MPETPPGHLLPEQNPPDNTLVLRILYEEQTRLRAELDELRKKQEEQQKKSDSKEGGDQDKDKKDGDKKEGDEKDGDKKGDKDKDKEEKKPPLKDRLRERKTKVLAWTREHPGATVLIAIGFAVLLIAIVLLWRYVESYENTDDAFVDGHTDPISPRIGGFVSAVYVENTYRVKKGQLLAQLDPRDYQVAKEQAFANVTQAEAGFRAQSPNVPITTTSQTTTVVNAQLSVASSEANVAAAKERYLSSLSDLRQAEANEANAAQEAERYRLLVVKQEVSRELYDQRATDERAQAALVASRQETAHAAQQAVTQAEAALDQARQQAEEARHNQPQQIAVQRETLAMRKANVDAAHAQADQSELNLEYTRIYAPEDGVIGDKQVQLGTQVAPGQELFALTQTNDVWVTANFKETQIRRMHPGQGVALPGASGAVYSLLPPENATGNYVKVVQRLPIRIRFNANQQGLERLTPGMSVEPKVWLK
jgi:membrane fusion protein (multidrug efflux system)